MYHLNVMGKTKIWFGISGTLIAISIISLIMFGLNLGIDFTGGSMMDIQFKNIQRPSQDEIKTIFSENNINNITIQAVGDDEYIIRMSDISESTHSTILDKLNNKFSTENSNNNDNVQLDSDNGSQIEIQTAKTNVIEEKRFDSIGPIIGQELKQKSIGAIIFVIIAIILYIAYVFRKVSKPIESWKYGVSAIIALIHDIIIITGIFSLFGYFMNVQIDAFFITALLTILGYSINDTIVTFDRIRENLHRKTNLTFKDLINLSINETITRSINTSFTTFIVLTSVFLFGGETVKYFVLALMMGIIIGTYSSIFLASPFLMIWYRAKYKQA
ncbi:MAG: protein translocase subunit SecF [Patescibacteria group bacterium]|nr:protein translocase subunit SecF [Patescibacteria group bacterium]MDD4304871.1 protein translocase subunit SecF [Patescibacteria group bacterium]MDD4695777.1 protein translocase subunit SecF [Patescibacteria group bacterium]